MRVLANAPGMLPAVAGAKRSAPSLSRARATDVKGAALVNSAVNSGHGDRIAVTRMPGMPVPVPVSVSVRAKSEGTPSIPRKATIGAPGDRYEREADDVASKVMAMTGPGPIGSAPSAIQRTCAKCEENTALPISAAATHSMPMHDSSHKPLASAEAVLGTALVGGGGTDEMHKQLVDDYTKDTGVENQPGLQYTQGYADWLQQQGARIHPRGARIHPRGARIHPRRLVKSRSRTRIPRSWIATRSGR